MRRFEITSQKLGLITTCVVSMHVLFNHIERDAGYGKEFLRAHAWDESTFQVKVTHYICFSIFDSLLKGRR